MKYIYYYLLLLLVFASCTSPDFYICAPEENNLLTVLEQEGMTFKKYTSAEESINAAPESASVLLLSQGYPKKAETMSKELLDKIESKNLKVYAEFVSFADTVSLPQALTLERVVVVDSTFAQELPAMKLLTLTGSYVLPGKQEQTILAVAKVAGMDKASSRPNIGFT